MTRAFGCGSAADVGVDIEVDAVGLAVIAGACEVEGPVAEGTSLLGGAVSTPPAEHATNRRATAGARLTSVETMTRGECYGGALPGAAASRDRPDICRCRAPYVICPTPLSAKGRIPPAAALRQPTAALRRIASRMGPGMPR